MPFVTRGRWAALLTALFLGVAHADLGERIKACDACHGANGISTTPGMPSLAGQPKVFMENYLVMTREGVRGTAAMQRLLHGATDREIVALSDHYAKLPPPVAPSDRNAALYEQGRQLAAKHRCGTCHLPDYSGRAQMQRLAGQREDYLVDITRRFRDAPPPGSETLMNAALYGVSDAEIRALAHFLSRFR